MSYPQESTDAQPIEFSKAQDASSFSFDQIDIKSIALEYGIPLLKAIFVLIVGLYIIKLLSNGF